MVWSRLLPLAALLLASVTAAAYAEGTPPLNPSSEILNVLTDGKHGADEFAEFDDGAKAVGSFSSGARRLQFAPGNGGSSNTVETRCNTWCKLKESLGLTIIGFLLICISPCLMWKNEGRHVNELRRIEFCKNKAVVVPSADAPSDETTGQLVHFSGKVTVDEKTLDLDPGPLNISAPLPKALVIRRTCLIYQKFEQAAQQTENDMIGAGQTTTTTYTVREDWTPNGPQPTLQHLPQETNSPGIWGELVSNSGTPESARPAQPSNLPPNMPPELMALLQQTDFSQAPHCIAICKSAHVGGFALGPDIVTSEPAVFLSEWMPVPVELIPDDIEALPELRKDRYGNLTTVEEGDQPSNGDVMIKYEYCADGFDASFVVQQILSESDPETGVPEHKFGVDKGRVLDEKCCGKISDDLGVIWMVRRGRHELHEMIEMAKKDEATVTKVLRILCWALLVAGWTMIFSIFTTLLSTLPLLGQIGSAAFFVIGLVIGTVCCCGVTAVAYLRYRPLITSVILAFSLAIAGICIYAFNDASENSMQPSPAPVRAPSFMHEGSDVYKID